jgi:serine phosphatase RsbU (regulator of sigma subunit)
MYNRKSYLLIGLFFILSIFSLKGQSMRSDTLNRLVEQGVGNNVKKVNDLNLMAKMLIPTEPESGLRYAQQALLLSERTNYQQGIGDALFYIASAYYGLNDYSKSLQYYLRSVKFYKSSSNHKGQAQSLQAAGNIYRDLGDYEQSLNYMIKALESNEKIRNKAGIAQSLSEIGVVQTSLRDFVLAKQSLEKALDVANQQKNPAILGIVYQSWANYYSKTGNLEEVLKNYQIAADFFREAKDKKSEARVYNGLGNAYLARRETNLALENYLKAINIQKNVRDSYGLSVSYKGIGELYLKTKTYERAIDYFDQSLKIAQQLKYKELIKDNYQWLAKAFELTEKPTEALSNYRLYKIYTDSVYNQSKLALIAEMQVRYGLDQQEKEVRVQERRIQALNKQSIDKDKEIESQDKNIHQRNLVIAGFSAIILLAIILLTLLLVSQRKIRQVNKQLNYQNKEITRQKQQLETKSDELVRSYLKITDSIRYAESIQTSLLPDGETLHELLGEYFVISRPKEIVSGDFYWVSKQARQTFIAVVDCTGHGVSGGFTSIIGQTLLNEIINQNHVTEPDKILYWLNQRVKQIIDFKIQEFPIGMEITLITIEEASDNPDFTKITFAGAKRPLYYILQEQEEFHVHEIRGSRQPVGFFQNQDHQYQQHTVVIEKGSFVYLSTDGYADQGNASNKRMGTPRMKRILKENAHLDLQSQKKVLEKALKEYQGKVSQRDDITLLGFRV